MSTGPRTTQDHIDLAERFSAHNYLPLPVVVAGGEGVWVTDVEGRRYLDMLAAYSALNFGHRHPALTAAAKEQLDRLTLTSRAFHNDQIGPFVRDLAELCGMEMALPMNSGAEGVETALKSVRKWGYEVKGVAPDHAKVIVCDGNFHGRTITIVSFSTDPASRRNFGPLTPGFEVIPYGDADALAAAIDDDTVAFLVEPVQGEAGIIVPPDGYLRRVREICTDRDVLLVADEIQTGLGRTGDTFAVEHEGVRPDVLVLGKALGGGIVPLSAVVADADVLGVFKPGEHGSTFGGNPIACAIGRRVISLLRTGELQEASRELGEYLLKALGEADLPTVEEVRGRGLWAGIQLTPEARPARRVAERLLEAGILAKDTHESTIRLAPPLVISREELEWGLERILPVLSEAGT
ncbi:MAG TPA: ornithine--oxo-acid transaminase [Actinomycetota bacterium]|nr:ornithine--oxo-acid transaminase [Actinomycetota bacterium]